MTSINDIIDDFALIDDWEERYRYVIELGRMLEPLSDEARSEHNKVRGCASQVWLETRKETGNDQNVRLVFSGDSDAHIVRGLIYILLTLFSGQTPGDILKIDTQNVFSELGLTEHLTPQRSNGVRAMVERIRTDAAAAVETAATQ